VQSMQSVAYGRCSGLSGKLHNLASFRCKRCVDGQLFQEVVAMKEIMISSLDKLECINKLRSLGGLIGACGLWRNRRSIKSKSMLCLGKCQGTGSSVGVSFLKQLPINTLLTSRRTSPKSERKSIHGLYPDCLGICE